MLHDLWQGHFRPTRKRNIALRTDEEEEQSTAASCTAAKHPSTAARIASWQGSTAPMLNGSWVVRLYLGERLVEHTDAAFSAQIIVWSIYLGFLQPSDVLWKI
jgi:hypothetical protein